MNDLALLLVSGRSNSTVEVIQRPIFRDDSRFVCMAGVNADFRTHIDQDLAGFSPTNQVIRKRDAVSGVSLRVDSAVRRLNPVVPSG